MMIKIDIHVHVPLNDPRMDRYLDAMDRHQVAAVLVHAFPLPDRDNDDVLRAVENHPDRLYGSVHVDLRAPLSQCIETVQRYADRDFRSIKLFPNLGFDPSDERLEPFWQEVEKAGLMCLAHCGYVSGIESVSDRISSLTASPFHFEIPLRRHPKINFIFAHFGGGAAYLETIVMISRFPNAYADTCPGWGTWVFKQPMPGLTGLDFSKILYGTDSAGDGYGQDEIWWTEKLTALGRSPDDLECYFRKNAARLLRLASDDSTEPSPQP